MSRLNYSVLMGLYILGSYLNPNIAKGHMPGPINDLSDFDFNVNKTIELDSHWVLYWNELLSPLDSSIAQNVIALNKGATSWTNLTLNNQSLPSFGYGTYVTTLLLPKERPSLSLRLPKLSSSAKIWVNNELLYSVGEVGRHANDTQHKRLKAVLPINSRSDTIKITVQIANYYHRLGGMTAPIELGKTTEIWNKERNQIISDMTLIGSLTFIGISFLILYYAYWRMDRAILYFAVFCLCWAYRTLSDGYAPIPQLIPDLPWVVHVKIEYFTLFLGSLMGSLFLNTIFKDHFHALFPKITTWLTWLFIALNFLLPVSYYTYSLPIFFVLYAIIIIYIVIKLLQISTKSVQSSLALLGIFSGLAVFSFHIYSYNILGQTDNSFINNGYLLVFMINSLLLGNRFSISFKSLKLLQVQTDEQNKEIGYQAELLNKANDLLEEKVAHRTQELQIVVKDLKERNINLEQFNYIISHNMRAPVSNMTGLLTLYNRKNPDDPFNKTVLGQLNQSCEQLDAVLKDLTTILEAKNQVDAPHEHIVFTKLVDKIQQSIKSDINEIEVTFELNFEVQTIHSIAPFWYSIFLNLISNAIKYRIPNVPCRIKISTQQFEKKMLLVFEDNGLGIDLSLNKDKVFGLYKRFHDHVDGKGMGLFMVKTQIEAMGGSILLESLPNKGCTFTIEV